MKTNTMLKNAGKMAGMASFLLGNADYLPTAIRAIRAFRKDNSVIPPATSVTDKNPFLTIEEKTDLMERADWLLEKVSVEPQQLIDAMPSPIGRFYQGEWAIYACAMTAVALCNIVRIYPDLKKKYLPKVPPLIEMIMSDELKWYDAKQWKEDPLTSLEGDKSHMTYLSLLAWPMTCFRLAGGDSRFDDILKDVCASLGRRMLNSRDLNLPSFPNGIVFLPDMMVTIIALRNYGIIFNGEYDGLVAQWVDMARTEWIDCNTGLLISLYDKKGRRGPMMGCYSALNCSYLSMIDEDFARSQYALLKQYFLIGQRYPSIREYLNSMPSMSFNVNAGPIIEGRSPSGTGFALGAATLLEDWSVREGLLKTAELAGKTIRKKGKRHYKLADIMLTGEAITLAMRTTQ